MISVASQCLESAYEISIDDEICKNNFDSGLDLVGLAEKSVIKVTYWSLINSSFELENYFKKII